MQLFLYTYCLPHRVSLPLLFDDLVRRFRFRNSQVRMCVVADDCALPRDKGITGRRGVAGTVLVAKVAGAAAEAGLSLEEVCLCSPTLLLLTLQRLELFYLRGERALSRVIIVVLSNEARCGGAENLSTPQDTQHPLVRLVLYGANTCSTNLKACGQY